MRAFASPNLRSITQGSSTTGLPASFTVHLDWDGDPSLQPGQALDSGLDQLAVQ